MIKLNPKKIVDVVHCSTASKPRKFSRTFCLAKFLHTPGSRCVEKKVGHILSWKPHPENGFGNCVSTVACTLWSMPSNIDESLDTNKKSEYTEVSPIYFNLKEYTHYIIPQTRFIYLVGSWRPVQFLVQRRRPTFSFYSQYSFL